MTRLSEAVETLETLYDQAEIFVDKNFKLTDANQRRISILAIMKMLVDLFGEQ